MAKTEQLLDTIGNMTVLELAEFVEAFKTKFNVTAVVASAAAAGPAAAAPVVEEKTEFNVVLEAAGEVFRQRVECRPNVLLELHVFHQ